MLAGLLLLVRPAYADESTEASAAAAAFEAGERVYISPEAGQQVEPQVVTEAIGSDEVFIAVVPPNMPPDGVLALLLEGTSEAATLVVVSGTEQAAQSSVICSDRAQPLLDEAAAAEAQTREAGDLTPFLLSYLERIDGAPVPGDDDCADEAASSTGLLSALPWILGAIVIGLGGGYLWLRYRRAQKSRSNTEQRRTVTGALDDLAREIDSVTDERDPQVEQALHDARERHIAAADILAEADASIDFEAALRATREGATAARYARQLQDSAVPAAPPVEPARADRVSQTQVLSIDGEQVTVHPAYRPGAVHYFAGNDELPAGWYSAPVSSGHLFGAISEDE